MKIKNKKNSFQKNNTSDQTNISNPNMHVENNHSDKNITKILLFPGENYEFDEKLLHYNVFGFSKENLVSKKCAILIMIFDRKI